jgi:FtsP/CotA-like multicopper oxidase with cupredoxin domain
MQDRPDSAPSRRTLLAGALTLPLLPAGSLAQQTPASVAVPLELPLRIVRRPLRQSAADSVTIACERVLRLKKGQDFALKIENQLGEPTALHLHGLRTDFAAQGMPGLGAKPIAPGQSVTLRGRANDAGSFLYLPVLPGRTAEHLERGLAGMVIVDEAEPQPVDLDSVAILDDLRLNQDGVLDESFGTRLDAARFGRLGNVLTINGKTAPKEIVLRPNARVRLRLASTANARIMPMKFQGGRQVVVAIDGQACDPFDPLKRTVVLLPGSRYEVMIDLPGEAGQEAGVFVETASLHKVLALRTEGEPLPVRDPVKPLPQNDVPAAIRLQNAARSEVAISGGLERAADPTKAVTDEAELKKLFPDAAKIYLINQGFNQGFAAKPILSVKRGTPVVLALTNRTARAQVLTIHGHVFRLLHPLDDGWEPYFLDTIHLPAMTTSRIAFDANNPGKWAIRSTIAEHYDAGVATWFEVT